MTFLPFTVSHTLPIQAGVGRQKRVAAASANSALDREESAPGKANSHDADI